jgi:hypothetical protein
MNDWWRVMAIVAMLTIGAVVVVYVGVEWAAGM